MIRILSLLILVSCAGGAAITGLRVVGSTNVQAVLSYESPVDSSCTVQVSESPDFRRLVHDVNPDLFPGSDSDARPGNVVEGPRRLFVIGKRAVEQAADGKWYSRALQTATKHYFRIRCGDDEAAGVFSTANIPVGVTYPWPIPQDPKTGQFRWPSVDNNDRSQTIIDPNYGTLIRRVSMPGDAPASINRDLARRRFKSAAGANWVNPELSLADDGASASNAAGSQDWLVLTDPGITLTTFYIGAFGIDCVVVRIKGLGKGASPEERAIDVCLTLDGSSCSSDIRAATLENEERTVTLGSTTPIDTWGRPLWPDAVGRNPNFGVMIRSRTGAPVEIQHVEMDVAMSERVSSANGGFVQTCALVKSNGGYHCAFPGDGGSNVLYWIHPETGEVRWLGKITATGWGGPNVPCRSGFAMFDAADPNVYYCSTRVSGKTVLLKGTYKGNDEAAAPGARAGMDWENMTPDPRTISDQVREFNPEFDPNLFPCTLASLAGAHAIFHCRRGGQDSIGWLAVFDLGNRQTLGSGGTGRIIAAAKSFASPNTRWCGLHAVQSVGPIDWIGWSPNTLSGGGDGGGPYSVTLQSGLPAGAGPLVILVSGEPEPYLMDAAAGDVFRVSGVPGNDFLRILEKRSSTEWLVERIVVGTEAQARDPGARLTAVCKAQNLNTPSLAPYAYWNFREDPHGTDATNTKWVVETQLAGGHIVERGDYRIMAHFQGYQVVMPGIPKSWNQAPAFRIPNNPRWSGVRAAIGLNADGLGNIYGQHPSFENYNAPGKGRNNWFVDLIPFIGNPAMTSSLTPVEGFSQVYKANGARPQRDLFPTFGRCGGRQLKEIPGPITDQDVYTFCVGSNCAAGAAASDVFVNCPPPVSASSRCTESLSGDEASVCVGDLAPYGQSVTQFFLDRSGARNRVLTNGLFAWHSPRTYMALDTASALPDGSWIVFPSYANNARKDLYMVKVPPQPDFDPDPGAGSGPVPMTISVTPPAGTSGVMLHYGNTPNLGSSLRADSCGGGGACSVTLRARPLELIFSRPLLEDGAGQSREGQIEVRAVGGIAGTGVGRPRFTAEGVVNGASFEQKLAPGAIASIFGEDLAPCEASAFPPPLLLCDTSLTFNGVPGYFLSASPGQLNVVLPSSIEPQRDLEIVIERGAERSNPVRVPGAAVGETAPAIFLFLDGSVRRAIVQNLDGSLNGPERPLRPGETATLYANALGPTEPPVPDGEPTPLDPLSFTSFPVDVVVNDVRQQVLFSGLTPGFVRLYQVNFTLDPATPVQPGDENRIWLRVRDTESPRLVVSLSP